MHDILVVYDNSLVPNAEIKNVVGDKSFGNVIFQKQSLKRHFYDQMMRYSFVKDILLFEEYETLSEFYERLNGYSEEMPLLHVYADAVAANHDDAEVLAQKVRFTKGNLLVQSNKLTAAVFRNVPEYQRFLQHCSVNKNTKGIPEFMEFDTLHSEAFVSISDPNTFLQYITKGFDTRYFNSLLVNDYIVTKTSANKKKIKSEYTFYHLLPEAMKIWFVLPFDYRENEKNASYSMERFHITDLAIKWVNRSVSLAEFEKILTMVFYFINHRSRKSITTEEYLRAADSLYIQKIGERMDMIKKSEIFPTIRDYIARGTDYAAIEDIVNEYQSLYETVRRRVKFDPISVIGHGDLCFSNMLYHNETSTLKFIDVKGALREEELWTDPYYDLAKLSHSICGRYDFFNSNLYDIVLSSDLKFRLVIDFDNKEYKKVFKRFLAENGFDYTAVRLFEASLFLSMVPLHVDHPRKVFGFLLNAIEILKEVKQCLKK